MSDPYINHLFTFVENLYGNNIDKHYIITTSPYQFKKINYLEPLAINTYDDIEIIINTLIEAKQEVFFNDIANETSPIVENTENEINLLIAHASPIDKIPTVNIDSISELFNGYKINIDISHLNIETLGKLSDFDYVIIKSQISRGSIVIEDEYFKSKLLKIDEISEFIEESNKGTFIFCEGQILNIEELTDLPIVFIEINKNNLKDQLSTFLYKAFKKADYISLKKAIKYLVKIKYSFNL